MGIYELKKVSLRDKRDVLTIRKRGTTSFNSFPLSVNLGSNLPWDLFYLSLVELNIYSFPS